MSAICIIPARGGSRRIPHKNIKLFHGKPIIAYSIEAARESGLFTHVFVSTEDQEITDVACEYEASVLTRPPELARDEVGTQEVMRSELGYLVAQAVGKSEIEFACCIYPCAPLMTAEDLRLGFKALTDSRAQTDFAYSVGVEPFRDAGNWYWGKTQSFLDGVPLDPDGYNIMKVVIPNERVCDINTPEDWAKAEAMYATLHPEVA